MTLIKNLVKNKVTILGGGISGLSFAFFLKKIRPNLDIIVLEKNKVGGLIDTCDYVFQKKGTDQLTHQSFEAGPFSLRPNHNGSLMIIDLLKQFNDKLEIGYIPRGANSEKKFLFNNKKEMFEVPRTFEAEKIISFLKSADLLNDTFFKGLIHEIFSKKNVNMNDESLGDFFFNQFGNTELVEKVISGLINGTYATNPYELSINSSFKFYKSILLKEKSLTLFFLKNLLNSDKPKSFQESELDSVLLDYQKIFPSNNNLIEFKKKLESSFLVSISRGIKSFIDVLEQQLLKLNVKIICDVDLKEIDPYDGYLVFESNGKLIKSDFDVLWNTVNINEISKFLKSKNNNKNLKKIKALIETFEYESLTKSCLFSFEKKLCQSDGFGFLVPTIVKDQHSLLGGINVSNIKSNLFDFFTSTPINNEMEKKSQNISLLFGGDYYNKKKFDTIHSHNSIIPKVLKDFFKFNNHEYSLRYSDQSNSSSETISLDKNEIFVKTKFYENCIPKFSVGYNKKINELNELTMLKDNESEFKVLFSSKILNCSLGLPDIVYTSFKDALTFK